MFTFRMRILYIIILSHPHTPLPLCQMHPHSTFTPAYPIALEGALEAHRVLAVRHLAVADGRHDWVFVCVLDIKL